MNRAFKTDVVALILAACVARSAAAGPFEDAVRRGDYGMAMSLLRPLAEQGNAGAQYNLGAMYDHGYGVPQDYAGALTWYRKAAEQGYANAQFNIGVIYQQGHGVPLDYVEALKWYRKAADQGDAQAQFNVALMYENGQGVPQDPVRALMWLSLAAAQGDQKAVKGRDTLLQYLSVAQIAEAQKLQGCSTL